TTYIPNARIVELPPARNSTALRFSSVVSALLGRHVPRGGRILEFSRRRHLRLPDQFAHRLLLRNWDGSDGQPRPRLNDGRVRNAGDRPGTVLLALHRSGKAVERSSGENQLLVAEPWPRLDGICYTLPAWNPSAIPLR